jgi:hypothetical protein
MPRGRRPNPLRSEARARGEKFFADATPCPICGDDERYTTNGACVTCARQRGMQRYAAMDADALAVHKVRDAARYRARRARNEVRYDPLTGEPESE